MRSAGWQRASRSRPKDPDILSRVSQYEMAYRMQDVGAGSRGHLEGTGARARDVRSERQDARDIRPQRLLARRLAERGVKFITLFQMGWDHHGDIQAALPPACTNIDQPVGGVW